MFLIRRNFGNLFNQSSFHSDSCSGAVRQDFSDSTCTTLDSTSDVDVDSGCVTVGGGFSYSVTCTSDSSPSLSYQALVTT